MTRGRPRKGPPLISEGPSDGPSAMQRPCDAQRSMPDARWTEYRPKDCGGQGTFTDGELQARSQERPGYRGAAKGTRGSPRGAGDDPRDPRRVRTRLILSPHDMPESGIACRRSLDSRNYAAPRSAGSHQGNAEGQNDQCRVHRSGAAVSDRNHRLYRVQWRNLDPRRQRKDSSPYPP